MTDFDAEFRILCEQFVGTPMTQLMEAHFKAACWRLVHRVYAESAYILDRKNEPILSLEDVDIVVTVIDHSMNVTMIRKPKMSSPKI